jgi:putative redox protein
VPVSALAAAVDPSHGLRVEATSGSGFTLTMDSVPSGEPAAGPTPREVVLQALAGCTAMDVASILRKKRQVPDRYEIAVTADTREEEHPHVFTRIVVEHRLEGRIEPEAARRSVELSATRYCPVNAMLSAAVTIEHRYLLRRPGQPDLSAVVVVTGPRNA